MSNLRSVLAQFIGSRNSNRIPARLASVAGFPNRLGWSPASLFANAENGVWIDPNDWSTLYQDTAGTTLVTAVGQTIGKALDKSGAGNHMVAMSDAARPILRVAASGRYYFEYDGLVDEMRVASVSMIRNVPGTTLVASAQPSSATSKAIVFVSRNAAGSSRALLNTGTAGGRRLDADANQLTNAEAVDTAARHLYVGRFTWSAAKCELIIDGVIEQTRDPFQTAGSCSDTANSEVCIGGSSNLGSLFVGNLYGAMIINRALTDTEIAQLVTYYA